MVEIICALIAAACSVAVALIGRGVRASAARTERHAKLRQEEGLLSMKMMDATMQLCIVTANALTGGHNNGNVERAREASKIAAQEYENFMRRVTAHEVGK